MAASRSTRFEPKSSGRGAASTPDKPSGSVQRFRSASSARSCWKRASTGMKKPTPAVYYNDQNPETIFYQGLALQKLGRNGDAKKRFQILVKFGQQHLQDEIEIDYFAVSLPEFMVFDDNLNQRNQINCRYLVALGCLGLGKRAEARRELRRVLQLDPAHLGAKLHLRDWLEDSSAKP